MSYVSFFRTNHGVYSTIPVQSRRLAEILGDELRKELHSNREILISYFVVVSVKRFNEVWNVQY